MILNLVSEKDPILRERIPDFDFQNPDIPPAELFESMKESLIHYGGYGLAANQVGIRARMFVFGDIENPDSIVGAFNPRITSEFGDIKKMEEGCLTFPGLFLNIRRHSGIRVRYTTHEGITDTIKFDGVTARIFLHEMDHLNGITFLDRASRLERERGRKKQKIWLRRVKAYARKSDGESPQKNGQSKKAAYTE